MIKVLVRYREEPKKMSDPVIELLRLQLRNLVVNGFKLSAHHVQSLLIRFEAYGEFDHYEHALAIEIEVNGDVFDRPYCSNAAHSIRDELMGNEAVTNLLNYQALVAAIYVEVRPAKDIAFAESRLPWPTRRAK